MTLRRSTSNLLLSTALCLLPVGTMMAQTDTIMAQTNTLAIADVQEHPADSDSMELARQVCGESCVIAFEEAAAFQVNEGALLDIRAKN